MRDLRRRCDWDARQTHESLRPYLVEEAHEVDEALQAGDDVTVPAGATNLSARLRLVVRSVGSESRIGKVMQLVETASLERPPIGPADAFRPVVRDGYIRIVVRGGAAPVRINGESVGISAGPSGEVLRAGPGTHYVTVRGAGDLLEGAETDQRHAVALLQRALHATDERLQGPRGRGLGGLVGRADAVLVQLAHAAVADPFLR